MLYLLRATLVVGGGSIFMGSIIGGFIAIAIRYIFDVNDHEDIWMITKWTVCVCVLIALFVAPWYFKKIKII